MTVSKFGAVVLGVGLALVIAMGVKTMAFGQVRTEKLPAPTLDEQSTAHTETAVFAGALFLGCADDAAASQGCHGDDCRVLWRDQRDRELPRCLQRKDPTRRIGQSSLRPRARQLRHAPPHLLFGSPRPNRAKSPGAGRRDELPLGSSSTLRPNSSESHKPTSRNWTRRRPFQGRS